MRRARTIKATLKSADEPGFKTSLHQQKPCALLSASLFLGISPAKYGYLGPLHFWEVATQLMKVHRSALVRITPGILYFSLLYSKVLETNITCPPWFPCALIQLRLCLSSPLLSTLVLIQTCLSSLPLCNLDSTPLAPTPVFWTLALCNRLVANLPTRLELWPPPEAYLDSNWSSVCDGNTRLEWTETPACTDVMNQNSGWSPRVCWGLEVEIMSGWWLSTASLLHCMLGNESEHWRGPTRVKVGEQQWRSRRPLEQSMRDEVVGI